MITRKALTIGTAGVVSITLTWACLFIDHAWILGSTELFRTPETIFRKALTLLEKEHPDGFTAAPATDGHANQTFGVDLSDLREALAETDRPVAEREQILAGYEAARTALEGLRQRSGDVLGTETPTRAADVNLPSAPEGVPQEFALYFEGGVQFHLGRTNQAQSRWFQLMDLPPKQRQYRSTWATFMLGRTFVDSEPELAINLFREVRDLVRTGYADSLGLASASLGWEARARLNLNDPEAAIALYLEQQNTGALDAASVRMAARHVLNLPPDRLISAARNPAVATVITSYLLSHADYMQGVGRRREHVLWGKWLSAALAADLKDPVGSEQFAWVSYQSGDFDSAAEWLRLADSGSPTALWLGAKLKLRDGELEDAALMLADATRRLPLEWDGTPGTIDTVELDSRSGRRRLHGEFGAVLFHRQEYIEALNTLLAAGYWRDAAYVADRILTLEELKSYVDEFWPANTMETAMDAEDSAEARSLKNRENLRYLLARRLARQQRHSIARNYFPDEWRSIFDELTNHLELAEGGEGSETERAGHLAAAAVLTRTYGLELYGTATAPDWQVFKGQFTYFGPALELRDATVTEPALVPAAEEVRRHELSAPLPNETFHYRWVAAELAWEAAQMMPDQSDETAALLNRAGRWVANHDPDYADKFYKALVIRCGHTELGTAADRKRWFPAMTNDGKLSEPMPPPVQTTYSGPWPGDPNR